MRAIRDIETGWLSIWWDPMEGENVVEPEPEPGQELIELDMTVHELEAQLRQQNGTEKFAGVYVLESDEAALTAAREPHDPKNPREILRGHARMRAEPPAPLKLEDYWPALSLLLEYAAVRKKKDNQAVTYADLKELSLMVAGGELGASSED